MQKISNLYLYPQEYKAFIDWPNEKIVHFPPATRQEEIDAFFTDSFTRPGAVRQDRPDEYGGWIMPREERPPRDIVVNFARLHDREDKFFSRRLASFVSQYGLLGITGLPDNHHEPPRYGKSHEEDIAWWTHYAAEVHRLLLLYKAIRAAREGDFDALDEVLEFRPYISKYLNDVPQPGGAIVTTLEEKETPFTESFWLETGEKTRIVFKNDPLKPGEELSASVLIKESSRVLVGSISRALAGGVFLGKSVLKPDKRTPIGFTCVEQRYTHSPLAAVYYGLWELVRGDKSVEVCAYDKCNNLFTPKRSTGKFCSPTCRVLHNRQRKNKPENIM